jgi:DNA-binding response OmpR family regulator
MINNESNGQERRILIIDDEPDICLTFKEGIEEYKGYRVDAFENPQEALRNFKAGKYELVLLDVKMPEMNGFQVYSEIKKIDSHVRALFVTAAEVFHEEFGGEKGGRDVQGKHGDGEYSQFCKLNKDMFLQKPIDLNDLINKINLILSN